MAIAFTSVPALTAGAAEPPAPQGQGMMRQMMQKQQTAGGMMNRKAMMKNNGMMSRGMMGKKMMGKGMMPMMMNGCRMSPMMMEGGMMSMMPMMREEMMSRGMMPMMGYNPAMAGNYLKKYKKFQKFFNETRNLRKKLNDLQFEYGEARWNPDTTLGELQRMRMRLNKLRQKIYARRPQ